MEKGQKNPNNQTMSDNKQNQKDGNNPMKSANQKHHQSPNEDEDDDEMQMDEKSPKMDKNDSKSMQHGKEQQGMKKPKLSNANDDPYEETPSEIEDERGFGDRNAQELKWIAEDEKTKKQNM